MREHPAFHQRRLSCCYAPVSCLRASPGGGGNEQMFGANQQVPHACGSYAAGISPPLTARLAPTLNMSWHMRKTEQGDWPVYLKQVKPLGGLLRDRPSPTALNKLRSRWLIAVAVAFIAIVGLVYALPYLSVRDQGQHQFQRRAHLSRAGTTLLLRNQNQRGQRGTLVLHRTGSGPFRLAKSENLTFLPDRAMCRSPSMMRRLVHRAVSLSSVGMSRI